MTNSTLDEKNNILVVQITKDQRKRRNGGLEGVHDFHIQSKSKSIPTLTEDGRRTLQTANQHQKQAYKAVHSELLVHAGRNRRGRLEQLDGGDFRRVPHGLGRDRVHSPVDGLNHGPPALVQNLLLRQTTGRTDRGTLQLFHHLDADRVPDLRVHPQTDLPAGPLPAPNHAHHVRVGHFSEHRDCVAADGRRLFHVHRHSPGHLFYIAQVVQIQK